MINYREICEQTVNIAKVAGDFIRENINKIKDENILSKGLHNYVTYVDTTSEKIIVDGLSKLLPESGFIAEENTSTKKSDKFNWIIDPLDGTTNFIHGLPPFAISIALLENKEVVVGVVYEMNLDECFYAWKDSKAYLNGNEICVTNTAKVKDSLFATGFPYYDYGRLGPFMKSLEYFMQHSHGLRRIGSAATDLAYVACGRFEGFFEYGLSPWDVAAGAFIVERAGGKISDFKHGNNYLFGKEIIASNATVYDEFSSIIEKIMYS